LDRQYVHEDRDEHVKSVQCTRGGMEGDAIALFVFMGAGAVISGLAVAVQRAPKRLTALNREADDRPKTPDT
jgi:hypothetical protein